METINTFAGYTSVAPMSTTLDAVTNTIMKDSRLKYLTEQYRQSGDKDIKASTPVFSVACIFEGGKQLKHVTALTGMSLVDCDHVSPERLADIIAKARADPHTLLAYTTISGSGLRIIFRYERDTGMDLKKQLDFYAKAFAYGNDYYAKLLDVPVDGQCKNVTRLSGMAYDPNAWYNPDAQPFGAYEIATHWKRKSADKKKDKRLRNVQSLYDKTLAAELEEEGAVYTAGRHNDYIMRLCYKLNQFGVQFNIASDWLKQHFPDYEQADTTLRSCYRNIDEFGVRNKTYRPSRRIRDDSNQNPYATVDEIKEFLEEHVELKFNEVTTRVEYRRKDQSSPWDFEPINDRIVNTLWTEMSKTVNVKHQDMLRIIMSEHTKSYHPFREYLDTLPPWHDGDEDHIRKLARTVTVEGGEEQQERFYHYLKKWLVGMLAGWKRCDIVNHEILVLIGEQGAYKTSWFNFLLPPQLKRYFHTKANGYRLGKDDMLTLAEYGLICCEELDTMTSNEVNQLKASVTMQYINERAPYAHFHEHRPHVASLCGTGNNTQFLSDHTGNRRWLPFKVENIVSPYDNPLDYTGIYSQAYALLQNDFKYWFDSEEITDIAKHNTEFETPRLEHELIMTYLRMPEKNEPGVFMTTANIIQLIGSNIVQKLSPVCVGRAMCDIGFEKVRNSVARGYIVAIRTPQEVDNYQKNLAYELKKH
ncbi:MAG: BT4734/BF3469 family protein [Prevotellaceae bacterium]|nr:BT4734/BF3469 family protein [Prevotellaceae bacterium]